MSQTIEKKYRVDSFDGMLGAIEQLGAAPTIEVFSVHYYARLAGNDTLKMVDYQNKAEIHKLSTHGGLHTLDEVIPLDSVVGGFDWFRRHGFHVLDILAMHDREYAYKDGGFALYDVDGRVKSVILGYAEDDLAKMEETFGLQSAEHIEIPYNKYLAQLGLLRSVELR